jgi:hypothetical protein
MKNLYELTINEIFKLKRGDEQEILSLLFNKGFPIVGTTLLTIKKGYKISVITNKQTKSKIYRWSKS